MNQKFPIELFLWVSALLFLGFTGSGQDHVSLCPLDNMGITWCPGCGLGRSLRHILHGEVLLSLQDHWFGIPALLILFWRIFILLSKFLLNLIKPKETLS